MNDTFIYSENWDKGSYNKRMIWGIYITLNALGVIFCTQLSIKLLKKRPKNSADIFLFGLCTGCIWMSTTCGMQCFLSALHAQFYGGEIACIIESFFHVSSILVQFFSVSALSIRNYMSVVTHYHMTVRLSWMILICIWAICLIVTFSLSFISPMYLMTAGTYCFFSFASPGIAFWLVPGLCISVIILIVSYALIHRTVKAISKLVSNKSAREKGRNAALHVVKKSRWFVAVLVIGWIFAAIATIYEYARGEATEFLVTMVGVFGTLHSCLVPLAYRQLGPRFKYHLDLSSSPSPRTKITSSRNMSHSPKVAIISSGKVVQHQNNLTVPSP